MADVDIDPFSEHDKTDEHPDQGIPLTLVRVLGGGSTWEPKQETFGGISLRMKVLRECIKGLY